jgi:hypothetical protein
MDITIHEHDLRVLVPKDPHEEFCDCIDWIEDNRFPYRFLANFSAMFYGIEFTKEDHLMAFKLRWI